MRNIIRLEKDNWPKKPGYYICQEYYSKEMIELTHIDDRYVFIAHHEGSREFHPDTLWSNEIKFTS